eukprot:gene1766-5825_t
MPQVRIRAIGVILLTTVVSTVVSIVSGYFVYAKSIESLEDTVKLLSEAQVDVLEASINETFGDVRRAQHVLSDLISSRWPAALLAPPPPAPPAPPADCDDALAGGPACTFGGMCDCQRDLIDAGYACGTAPPTPNSGAAMAEAKKPMPKAGFVKVEKEALKRVSEDELMSVQKKIKED